MDAGTQYSPSNRSAVGFWRDPLQCVHLQGHLCAGVVHKPMFTLPLGMRPAKNKTFVVAGGVATPSASEVSVNIANSGDQAPSSLHIVRISETGDVVQDVGNNSWISLDGISFRAGD